MHIKLRKIIVLLMITSLLATLKLRAQELLNNEQSYQNFGALSATARSFSRFGHTPVSLSTGQVKINLQLYHKKIGSLDVDISLMYTGGNGIKIEDPGSTVGRGWLLNTGGVVTRNRRGLCDDDSYHNSINYNDRKGLLYNGGVLFSAADGIGPIVVPNYRAREVYESDNEHDVFEFSFLGRSGKFYIGRDKSILLAPQSSLKIVPAFTNSGADTEISSYGHER